MRLTITVAAVLGTFLVGATKESSRHAMHQSSNIISGAYLVEFADQHVCSHKTNSP